MHGTATDRQESWELPAATHVVAKAREMVRTVLVGWDLNELADDLVLMTDEAVSNAIIHGRGPLTLLLRHTTGEACAGTGSVGRLVCEVTDTGPGRPRQRHADTSDECGRGLAIIAALAQAYGVREGHPGKTFWFSVPTSLSEPTGEQSGRP